MLGNDLHVVEVDATEQPELASRWGVMSVPTAFLFDPRGQLRHVNHGVTRAEKLLIQFQTNDLSLPSLLKAATMASFRLLILPSKFFTN